MFGPDGAVLSADRGRQVQAALRGGRHPPTPGGTASATVRVPPDVLDDHAELACDAVSAATRRAAGFRVLLDGNGGAGGPLGARLLRQLGCEVVRTGTATPDGVFAHEAGADPGPPGGRRPRGSKRSEAAVGFVLDPDADRLALIDEKGDVRLRGS